MLFANSFLSLIQYGTVLGRCFCVRFCQAILQCTSGCSVVTLLSTKQKAVFPWLVVWLLDKIISSDANLFIFREVLRMRGGARAHSFRMHVYLTQMHYNTTYADKRDAKDPSQSKDLPPKRIIRDVRLLLVQHTMWERPRYKDLSLLASSG